MELFLVIVPFIGCVKEILKDAWLSKSSFTKTSILNDWSSKELMRSEFAWIEKAKLADFQFVALGENRLRAETAGMMACAIFSMI